MVSGSRRDPERRRPRRGKEDSTVSSETEAEAADQLGDVPEDDQGPEDVADDTSILKLKPADFVVFP